MNYSYNEVENIHWLLITDGEVVRSQITFTTDSSQHKRVMACTAMHMALLSPMKTSVALNIEGIQVNLSSKYLYSI